MRKKLRIFISSPGDVNEERLRAHLVIQKLARDYARFFEIEAYLWEHEPMLASGHFQDAIDPPSATDVVVLIVYARLGTALPEKTAVRDYRGIDGRVPVTGTEWEFEDALAANRAKGAPDLLAYRKSGDPGLSLTDAARRAEQEKQWTALESFWRRHFEDSGMFLAGSSRFAQVEEFDQKLESDLTALIERKIATAFTGGDSADEVRWLKGSPFRGLSAYEFADADIFFGRDGQTRDALTRLQGAAENGCAFLMLVGASGSGKSSLARAGVLPALFVPRAIPGVGVWRRVVMRPADGGDDPILRLAVALASGDPAQGIGLPEMLSPGTSADTLAAHLAASVDDPTFPFRLALDRVAAEAKKARRLLPHETARLVILIDQFEELFTRGIEPARRDLFLRLLTALAKSGLVWIVATMRGDLWHRASEAKLLLDLVEAGARIDLPQPDGAELIEIVRRPAAAAGIKFDTDRDSGVGLDAVIARAAAEEPGVLPLLSVLLDTLYERDIAGAKEGGRRDALTFESYRALGELKGAIAQRADHALARLRESDPEAAAAFPRVLRALVTVSQNGVVTSRPTRLDAFPEGSPEARLINAFLAADARLLVASARAGGAEVRLAHEALLVNWPAAREQIQNDRRDLETRSRVETLFRRWQEAPNAAEKKRALLRGLNLAEGVDLTARWSVDEDIGTYVRTSARAEKLRRSWFAATAAGIALVFAAIAAFAAFESRRAEREAQTARNAEVAERGARENAVAERSRAVESEQRAVSALRASRLQAARALAAQAESAAGRSEIRQALRLAVQAGEAEREALDPGMQSAAEPALLKAIADVREVLHVRRKAERPQLAFATIGDGKLAFADLKTGLTIVDLATGTRKQVPIEFPDAQAWLHLTASNGTGLIAVAGGARLVLFDAGSGEQRGEFKLPARITSLDIHEPTQRLAVSSMKSMAIVDLKALTMTEPMAVDAGERAVGFARFTRGGDKLMLGIGVEVRSFDPADRTLGEVVAELDAGQLGLERAGLDGILSKAILPIVQIERDPARDRLFMWHVLQVTALEAGKPPLKFDMPMMQTIGFNAIDTGRKGVAEESVAIFRRRLDDTHDEIMLSYLGENSRLLFYERFNLAADDTNGEVMSQCRVSLHTSYLACHYSGSSGEGLRVFRLLGGAHRMERIFGENSRWGVVSAGRDILVGSDSNVRRWRDGAFALIKQPGGSAGDDAGGFFSVHDKEKGESEVFRRDGDKLTPFIAPQKAVKTLLHGGTKRAAFVLADRATLFDLASGKPVAILPGLDKLGEAAFSADGARFAVATPAALYVFDAASGRLEVSLPVENRGATFDADAKRALIVTPDAKLAVVDLAGRKTESLAIDAARIANAVWMPGRDAVILGRRDGGVMAVTLDGKELWQIASPLGSAFSEGVAWPDQPPKGLVLGLRFSPDGTRLAILRQDLPSIDLHETENGRYLTRLSSPWSWGVPAGVALGADGLTLASWSAHAMTRERTSFVSLHLLPQGLDAALAVAKTHLKALETTLTLD